MSYDTLEFSNRRRTQSLAVDRVDEQDFQRVKLVVGDEGEANAVSDDNPIPVAIISGGGGGGGTSDITSVIPGTGATNLGKAEDAAHASGDVGVMGLGVRRDSNTSLVDSDGDYAPYQLSAAGGLKVSIIEGAGSGGTSSTDDAPYTVGSASGTPIMGVATSDNIDSGDVGVVAMTTARALHVSVQNSFIPVTDNGGSLTVDGSVSATVSGTVTANLAAGTNNIGDVDVLTLPALPSGSNNIGDVDIVSHIPGTGATNLGKAEDAVHTSGDTGVMILGVRRDSASSGVSADGDYCAASFDANGALRVTGGTGGTSMTDGSVFTRESTTLTPMGAMVETSAPTLTNGDVGIPSMTTGGALRVNVASGGILGVTEDVASAGGEEGVLCMTVRQDTPAGTTSTDGDFQNLKTDSIGRLHVNVGNTVTVGSHAVTNAGTFAVQESQIPADDATFTVATTKVYPSGHLADETATDSVDEGDVGVSRMTLDRKTIVTPYVHAAAGGTTPYTALSTAAVLTAQIKGSAGKVFAIQCMNINAAARFVRLYNQTGAPASTDGANIVWRGIIPGATTGSGFTIYLNGMQFSTGIGIRASTGIADNDTGALAANELVFNVEYV